jgi:hypothetical protein
MSDERAEVDVASGPGSALAGQRAGYVLLHGAAAGRAHALKTSEIVEVTDAGGNTSHVRLRGRARPVQIKESVGIILDLLDRASPDLYHRLADNVKKDDGLA